MLFNASPNWCISPTGFGSAYTPKANQELRLLSPERHGVLDVAMVNGILTPSDIQSAPDSAISAVSHKKSELTRQNHINWQTILKDATFHTLIKHTGFTPSLDEKIETDRLLWEKIQAARFLKKQGKIDDFEKVKTGVLVDTTRERGYLEFRQSDRSVYNCEQSRCKPILDRLLAIWRVQRFESSNSIWIRVKLPRYQLFEDIYEYTPLHGLKQINIDNLQQNNKDKHNSWKHSDTDSEKLEENEKSPISRIDSKYFHLNDGIKNMYKKPSISVYKPQTPTYTILGTNPRQSYVPYVLGLPVESIPRPEVKNAQWNQRGAYYQIEPITLISEFRKNEKVYDGFIPSAGPTGSPSVAPVYQPTIPKPVMEQYPPFIPPRLPNPNHYYTSTTPKNFKPSTEFVRYSEPDPFYLDNSYAYTTPRTNDLSDIKYQDYQQYPTSINSQLLTYDKERNVTDILTTSTTVRNIMTTLITTKTEPTPNIINILETTDGEKQILLPTNSIVNLRPTTALNLSTINNKEQVKTEEKKSLGSSSSSETYDGYAPLFIKWGDKIKPSQNRSSHNGRIKAKNIQHVSKKNFNVVTITEEPTTISVVEKLENSTDDGNNILTTEDEIKPTLATEKITTEANEEMTTTIENTTKYQIINLEDVTINENNNETYGEQSENTTSLQLSETTENELTPISEYFNTTKDSIIDDWQQQTTSVIDEKLLSKSDATTFPIDSGTTNLVIDVEDKSPEEIVNELTTIGVKNSSRVEGYSDRSESLVNKYSSITDSIPNNNLNRTKTIRDQEAEQTDPTSVIVNRISTSYSYKTAKGKIRNLKPFVKDR
ncbi:hypothetical protein O3M35_008434 [Rhynocoris fuscipes]|uniref:Uncharacterized protein n=1 Tax=Rhynocoris fuscipes TaxID=488301 RepID=A0AAW1D8L2_9HEMI